MTLINQLHKGSGVPRCVTHQQAFGQKYVWSISTTGDSAGQNNQRPNTGGSLSRCCRRVVVVFATQ